MKKNKEQWAVWLHQMRGPGIFILGCLLFLAGLYRFRDRALPTGSSGERKLPIYCVKTDEPEVALTFDAAWGGGSLRNRLPVIKQRLCFGQTERLRKAATIPDSSTPVSQHPDKIQARGRSEGSILYILLTLVLILLLHLHRDDLSAHRAAGYSSRY